MGPPPAYSGSLTPGDLETYMIRARLWLSTTKTPAKARGPRMLSLLTGPAFEAVKHLAMDDVWMGAADNGVQLLTVLNLQRTSAKRRKKSSSPQ